MFAIPLVCPFAAHHQKLRRLHMSEKFSSGTINPKQTKKPLSCFLLHAEDFIRNAKGYILIVAKENRRKRSTLMD